MNESIVELAHKRLGESFSKLSDGQTEEAISPDLISILVDLGVTVIKGCLNRGTTPQAIVAASKQGGLLVRLQIRRSMRQNGVENLDRARVVQALLNAGGQSKPEEVQQLATAVD